MARTKQSARKARENKRKAKQKEAVLCTVCGKGDGRYKCPKCRAPFCCVQCSKYHKANSCPASSNKSASKNTAATSSDGTTANNANTEQSKYLSSKELKTNHPRPKRVRRNDDGDDSDSHDDEPGWNITPEMKKRIQQSNWLHKELRDGGLRQLIEQIDAASDDENEGGTRNKRHQKNNTNNVTISPRELALARTKHSHPKFASFVDQMMLSAGVLQPAEGGADDTILSMLEGNGPLVLAPAPRRSAPLDASVQGGSDSGSSVDSTDVDEDSDESESSAESEGSNGIDESG